MLLLVLVIPLTIFISSQQQTLKQRAASQPLILHIVGNHLVDSQGQTIRLIGINHGAATECTKGINTIFDGPSDQASVVALTKWHINTVRITMNEDCWLGINNAPAQTSGSNYRNAIIHYIQLLHTYGIYAIVDLHMNAPGNHLSVTQQIMADADHAPTYWSSVASTFKNDPAVIFEPYNEPDVTTTNSQTTNPWNCWLHGCVVNYLYSDFYNGTRIPYTWQTTGMQQLVNAIRATGATNVITIGGLSTSHDLSQLLTYLPSDPQHQLAATFHNYERATFRPDGCGPTCWDSVILPISQQMPVITDEFGDTECQTNYAGYVTQYMNWADQHGISYLPWGWFVYTGTNNCTNTHQYDLLANWNGTPNYYGKIFYDHFAQINPNPSITTSPTLSTTPPITQNPSPSPSSSPSSSPNPSPGKGKTIFSLTICPHDLGNCGDNANPHGNGNQNAKHQTRSVTLSLFTNSPTPVATADGIVRYIPGAQNFQGDVQLANLPSGNYLVKITMPGYLVKQIPGIITVGKSNGKIDLPEAFLVTGDVNNDNELNILDYNEIVSCLDNASSSGCLAPNTNQTSGADLSDDGVVDIIDLNIFLRELAVQAGAGGGGGLPTPTPNSSPTPTPIASGYVHVSGRAIVDGSGHQIHLTGSDEGGHLLQGEGNTKDQCGQVWQAASPGDIANMKQMGFNTDRIGISWANIEPTAPTVNPDGSLTHHWNAQYLAAIDSQVQYLKQNGMMAILDMHQAEWSPYFTSGKLCQGSGEPTWLYTTVPNTSGGVDQAKCEFFSNIAERNVPEKPQDGMAAAWKMLAARYAGNATVIGADMFNEPLFSCSTANLAAFYEKEGSAIRSTNSHIILMYEDNAYDSYMRRGFVLERKPNLTNALYSWHLYSPDWATGQAPMAAHLARAVNWDVPLWIGESDAMGGTRSNSMTTSQQQDLNSQMTYFKNNDISWTIWAYDTGCCSVVVKGTTQPKQPLISILKQDL